MNKPPMPEQPKTKEIPRVVPQVPATLEAVLREVRASREETRSAVANVADQVSELTERMRKVEERQDQSSVRVRGTSENDLKQDAAIARVLIEQAEAKKRDAEAKKRDEDLAKALAENTALTDRAMTAAGSALKHPVVVAFLMAAFAFATAWLQRHT